MGKATSLEEHYHQLLQLTEGWEVKSVDFDMKGRRVSLRLEHRRGVRVLCAECGASCTIADHAPERTWRHLDTMHYETVLVARLPRADCQSCDSPRTVEAPWAGKHSPYTWLFESLAVAVLQAAGTLSDACDLLRIRWDAAHRLMERAVERGMERRQLEGLRHMGMDEKSFKRGHSYITTLNEVGEEGGRVIAVVEGRSSEAATELLQSIPELTRSRAASINGCAPMRMGAAVYRGWRRAVMRSRLEPLKRVARMVDEHWQEILNYIRHRITNAVSEGLNSRIQAIKSAARGFRSFLNYRTRILFHCGRLDMQPPLFTH